VFADPHVRSRGAVIEMRHATGALFKLIANPVRLSQTPPEYRLPPPMLGEHTDAILERLLGLAEPERAALRERKVI
jgi:crotonobetainyl-CoA:carnitine CoA-transferase CaiB-like acyl-CoA transferase